MADGFRSEDAALGFESKELARTEADGPCYLGN
jgi:hypothetical protein